MSRKILFTLAFAAGVGTNVLTPDHGMDLTAYAPYLEVRASGRLPAAYLLLDGQRLIPHVGWLSVEERAIRLPLGTRQAGARNNW